MQNTQRIFNRIKQVSYNQVLAVLFVVSMFYIASATLPSTIMNIGSFLKDEKRDILSTRQKIDDEYRNMLEFHGNYFINKGAYINLNGLMARVIGQRWMNERVKLNNGHLTYLWRKQNTSRAAIQMTKLNNAQIENGGNFLFVLAPHQIPGDEDILPVGYKDYGNQNADELLDKLRKNNVPYLDLRKELRKDDISYADAFFVTDHHWKPETGFWAYTKTIDYLISESIIQPIDSMYTDKSFFNVEVYKNWILGSNGKRTGSYYAGVDDFSIITPKFETEITLEKPIRKTTIKGSFAEVAYNYEKNVKDYFSANPYAAYGNGERDTKYYRNVSAPVDLKVLGLKDSFGLASFTFLPLVFSVYDELDMRNYNGDFLDYYTNFEPDIVLIIVNSSSQLLDDNTTYDYFNDLTK